MKTILPLLTLLLGLLLACSRGATVTPMPTTATATTTTGTTTIVTSTTISIPDRNFEQALIDQNIDSDKTINGQLLRADALKVTSINIAFKSIADLTGIEGFTNLTALMCGYNKLTTLNLSTNTALTKLVCHYNSLTGKLELKAQKSLASLDAVGNTLLTTICVNDVSAAAATTNWLKDATTSYSTCP